MLEYVPKGFTPTWRNFLRIKLSSWGSGQLVWIDGLRAGLDEWQDEQG
jgi:hypothetical protein